MRSSQKDEMIKNLNEIVVPALQQFYCKGSFQHFRRMTSHR
jgi:hypothetical protein